MPVPASRRPVDPNKMISLGNLACIASLARWRSNARLLSMGPIPNANWSNFVFRVALDLIPLYLVLLCLVLCAVLVELGVLAVLAVPVDGRERPVNSGDQAATKRVSMGHIVVDVDIMISQS